MERPTTTQREPTPRSIREEAGLKQVALAKRALVSQPTLSHIEQGGSARLYVIQRVAHALGCESWEYVRAIEARARQRRGAALFMSRQIKRHEFGGKKP